MKSNSDKKRISTVMSKLKDRLDTYAQHSLDNEVNSVSVLKRLMCLMCEGFV